MTDGTTKFKGGKRKDTETDSSVLKRDSPFPVSLLVMLDVSESVTGKNATMDKLIAAAKDFVKHATTAVSRLEIAVYMFAKNQHKMIDFSADAGVLEKAIEVTPAKIEDAVRPQTSTELLPL